MCGRYYVPDEDSAADLREIIEQINRRANAGPVVKTGEIAPSDVAPVLANNRNLAATPFAMRWGYRLGNGKLLFNARSETADAKALFRDGMRQRRCLVPAAHYFEWEKRGKDRIKYAIRPGGASVMYMAGIYRLENDMPVFTILTREPAAAISFIHDRRKRPAIGSTSATTRETCSRVRCRMWSAGWRKLRWAGFHVRTSGAE